MYLTRWSRHLVRDGNHYCATDRTGRHRRRHRYSRNRGSGGTAQARRAAQPRSVPEALSLATADRAGDAAGQLRRVSERAAGVSRSDRSWLRRRSEEHTAELQSLMRISYAVFCLKKKIITKKLDTHKVE